MGFRFSIEHANWVAHLLHASGSLPPLENEEAHRTLEHLLGTFETRFFGSDHRRRQAENAAQAVLEELERGPRGPTAALLRPLRYIFADAPWVALIVPSGTDAELDRFLTSRELLRRLVSSWPDDPGLILQLESAPERILVLNYIFPAFKVALANSTEWPGVLVWTPNGDAAFFPIPGERRGAMVSLNWLFANLAGYLGVDLDLLRRSYDRDFAQTSAHLVHLLHLSDVHLGSKIAARRLPRVERVVRSVASELGEDALIVPVVTGDLMDTPDKRHLDSFRAFHSFLQNLGVEDPLFVLGNHDVRKAGWLSSSYRSALEIPTQQVLWVDEAGIGLVCFDSVRGGKLARGEIGERQMMDVGNLLDREQESRRDFTLIGLLHHHPTPVERPDWYHRPFYERLLGGAFDETEALEDADLFLDWARSRAFAAMLHGHRHIPRVDTTDGIVIVGCGSSVGKVHTQEPGRTFMSLNVVTIDSKAGRISCHLRAERIPGAGLEAHESHEVLYRAAI